LSTYGNGVPLPVSRLTPALPCNCPGPMRCQLSIVNCQCRRCRRSLQSNRVLTTCELRRAGCAASGSVAGRRRRGEERGIFDSIFCHDFERWSHFQAENWKNYFIW